ncbi:MAG: ankyrin repeat domain-containing protein [Candidatus Hydrogenedentes bacterium]|nr:ankyrin repeat domain-containing protein [Candidatus Hydrogenedentota bacterium]
MDHPWMYTMDTYGETPTTRARKSGYTVLAEMLLSQERALTDKESPTAPASGGDSAYWGMSHSVHKMVLDAPAPARLDDDIDRLLHQATQNGDVEQVRNLLDQGANVDHENEQGLTPLHWSALNGRSDLAEILIEHGAAINQREGYTGKLTPMAMALLMGYDDVVELMAARGGVC